MMNNVLEQLYYNPENSGSYGGVNRLYLAARQIDPNIKVQDVKNFLSSQNTYTLHRPARRRFTKNRIYVSYIDEQWEMDLIDMQKFSRQNTSFKYILVIIDSFSKFLFAKPLKSKSVLEIIKIFNKIFKERKPVKLRSDRGLEFANKVFENFCVKHDVRFFTTQNKDIKCAIVERVNRTIKEKLFRIFTNYGTRRWVDFLPQLVKAYNNSKHRSTHMTPNEIDINDEKTVFRNLYGASNYKNLLFKNIKPILNVGDSVRIKYDLSSLDKSYYPLWSEIIYKVYKILRKTNKPLYVLTLDGQQLNRRFYPEELQKVSVDNNTLYRVEKILGYRTLNGVRQARIKWLGYSSNHNSWIPVTQLQRL